MKRLFISFALFACMHVCLNAQVVYAVYSQGASTYFAAIDISTCTSCILAEWSIVGGGATDLSILPDGRVAIVASCSPSGCIRLYTPPDPTQTLVPMPHFPFGSIVINDLMYIHTISGLYVFDPTTDQLNFVGPWPAAMTPTGFEFYELGGQVYAIRMGGGGGREIWQVDLQNPQNSVFVQNTPTPPNLIASAASVNGMVYLGANPWLLRYDPVSNTFEQECNLPAMGIVGSLSGLSFLPAGLPDPPCLCTTQAGSMEAGAFNLCGATPVQATHNGNAVLDGDDLLGFILFSDPADTLGSILFTSSSSVFDFALPLQYDQTYYIAAIAGNNLNGNVDLSDPCLNISNAVTVLWRPLPTVALSVVNPDICPGACTNVAATFTGTAPFTLTYTANGGSPVTQTFSSNTGSFQVCVPANAPAGGFGVQATALTNAWCICN